MTSQVLRVLKKALLHLAFLPCLVITGATACDDGAGGTSFADAGARVDAHVDAQASDAEDPETGLTTTDAADPAQDAVADARQDTLADPPLVGESATWTVYALDVPLPKFGHGYSMATKQVSDTMCVVGELKEPAFHGERRTASWAYFMDAIGGGKIVPEGSIMVDLRQPQSAEYLLATAPAPFVRRSHVMMFARKQPFALYAEERVDSPSCEDSYIALGEPFNELAVTATVRFADQAMLDSVNAADASYMGSNLIYADDLPKLQRTLIRAGATIGFDVYSAGFSATAIDSVYRAADCRTDNLAGCHRIYDQLFAMWNESKLPHTVADIQAPRRDWVMQPSPLPVPLVVRPAHP